MREHDAAAALPELSLRHPLRTVEALLTDRSWLGGFALETGGFTLYVAALALAPLTLVQSVAAGGIGVLAVVSARMGRLHLGRQQLGGVLVSMLGLLALAVSLQGGTGEGTGGSITAILLWLGASAAAALAVLAFGRKFGSRAVTEGVAGGLLFSIGDISVKAATQGGARIAFTVGIVAGYSLGTVLLQLGYQKGGALTVAGLATLLTNALPIAAGSVALGEPTPSGAYGALRILAFAAVTLGAILLARPGRGSAETPRATSAS